MIGALFVALPIILWIAFKLLLPRGPFEMDHGPINALGTFFPLLANYQNLFRTVGVLALAAALASYWLGQGLAAIMLACSCADAIVFCVFLIFFYESYMAARYPRSGMPASNYTSTRYALILALGFSSIALFVGGIALAAYGAAQK